MNEKERLDYLKLRLSRLKIRDDFHDQKRLRLLQMKVNSLKGSENRDNLLVLLDLWEEELSEILKTNKIDSKTLLH